MQMNEPESFKKNPLTPEVVKTLKSLEDKYGVQNYEKIVEAASEKTSVLHSYFTWDKDKASYQYNLEEARQLLRRVVYIKYDTPVSKPTKIVYIKSEPSTPNYVSIPGEKGMVALDSLKNKKLQSLQNLRSYLVQARGNIKTASNLSTVLPTAEVPMDDLLSLMEIKIKMVDDLIFKIKT
jgi:hypothetical protein